MVAMLGPLFSINSDIKHDLSHTDLQEILKNETLSKGNLDFNQILQMIAGSNDLVKIKTANFELEDLGMSQEKLGKSGINMEGEDASIYYHHYLM